MSKLPKICKVVISIGILTLIATLAFYYFTDWRYPVPGNSQIVISLSRGGAWLNIESYEVTIYEDGTVVYEGRISVGAIGIRKRKIEPAQVRILADMIEEAGFFEFEDKYFRMVSDAGGVSVYARIGQKEKSVARIDPAFLAPIGTPDSLYRIEDAIIETANIDQWVNCNFGRTFWSICGFSPVALVASVTFFGFALWLIWKFMERQKTFLGILSGFGTIFLHGAISWYGNWSFPTSNLSLLLVTLELIVLLPASLSLIWWHKRKTKTRAV